MESAINHPSHYGGENNPYEAIKVINAWTSDFYIGNILKYICRAGKKESEIEDLKKARWYLDHKIKLLQDKADALKQNPHTPSSTFEIY